MRIHFYKLHLGGNSFILIDSESEKDLKLSEYPEISKSICNRRYGVGASGCIFLDEKNNMRLYRPDGTEASDFYDALFCAARYAFDSGRMNKNSHGEYEIRFNTLKGEKILKVISSREFELSLGSPFSLSSGKIINSESSSIMETIELEGKKIKMAGIHILSDILVSTPKANFSKPFFLLYTKLREIFKPQKIYLTFCQAITKETLCIRTIKRGENTSCASAAAALISSVLSGISNTAAVCIFTEGNKSLFEQQNLLAKDTDDSKKITILWDTTNNSLRAIASGGYLFEGYFEF